MAVETTTVSSPLVETIVQDSDADLTVETAAAAAQKLYFVEITNSNTDEATYVKLFAASSNSSTASQHYLQFYCPASTTCYYYIPASLVIANGIQFYASKEAGVQGVNSVTVSENTKTVSVKIGSTNN
tara:strand:+ start:154 stop:537 length:384 start_codon:yes stop_codon:yes gene_type:complete